MSSDLQWHAKIRQLHNHHFDSTLWDDLEFRDDDIVISTCAKAPRILGSTQEMRRR